MIWLIKLLTKGAITKMHWKVPRYTVIPWVYLEINYNMVRGDEFQWERERLLEDAGDWLEAFKRASAQERTALMLSKRIAEVGFSVDGKSE